MKPLDRARLILEKHGITLFTDQYGVAYAEISEAQRREIYPLEDRRIENLVVRFLMQAGEAPSSRAISETRRIWRVFAEDETRQLEVRSHWGDPQHTHLLVDLCDDRRRAVRIGPDGCRVVDAPPGIFRRFSHMAALPVPELDGVPSTSIRDLLRFTPSLSNPGDDLLLLAFAVLALLPIERPILQLIGSPGVGKTTLARRLQRLIDPSTVELLGQDPRANLALTFREHLLPVFDNLGPIPPLMADVFCRATSGAGFQWRRLYTDQGTVNFHFKRPIVITALHPPTARTDFADRSLILTPERRGRDGWQPTSSLDAAFEVARPRLFGGLVTALSRTLALLPQTSREGLSRLSDFHLHGRAVAQALGYCAEDFDNAYAAARERQQSNTLEDPLTLAVWFFAQEKAQPEPWVDTASQLWEELGKTASKHQIPKDAEWPRSHIALGRRIEDLQETLRSHGVLIGRPPRGTNRSVRVHYSPTAADNDED